MAGNANSSSLSPSSLFIGDCEIEVEGNAFSFEQDPNLLEISVVEASTIKVSVRKAKARPTGKRGRGWSVLSCPFEEADDVEENGKTVLSPSDDYSFVALNPKDSDRFGKLLLQNVLEIYTKELPSMKYAANTGKESQFLERCVFGWKYCTLLLTSGSVSGNGEVIAAASYQIIFPDTQFAEIPVLAVSSGYQHKGIGCLLYMELRKRLQNIGVSTVFCWGDSESEGFWLKQGFVTIAEVASKGRGRKLPIKADIRRALCFPGDSILMVSHLNKCPSVNASAPKFVRLCSSQVVNKVQTEGPKASPVGAPETSLCNESSRHSFQEKQDTFCPETVQIGSPSIKIFPRDDHLRDMAQHVDTSPSDSKDSTANAAAAGYSCSCSALKSKRVWISSSSSLNSKRVKGHHIECNLVPNNDLPLEVCSKNGDYCTGQSIGHVSSSTGHSGEKDRHINITSDGDKAMKVAPLMTKEERPIVMLMNISDEIKKMWLKEIVEWLGGSITVHGNACTHVVTGKARSTLNFCTALCSGAWIVSSNWIKASVRVGMFVDELPFILGDEDYVSTYKSQIKDTVLRARVNPHSLLKGYDIYLSQHVQPPATILIDVIKSAGGKVISNLDEVDEPSKAIAVACEDDMEEALLAVKRGVWTYSSEWFMNCVMRQELDFEAPQFAESL